MSRDRSGTLGVPTSAPGVSLFLFILLFLGMAPEPIAAQSQGVPPGMNYVASTRGQVYYWVGCSAWRSLSVRNRRFFRTQGAARAAGYRPSRSRGCAGPGAAANRSNGSTSSRSSGSSGSSRRTEPVLRTPSARELSAARRHGNAAPCQVSRITDGDTVACADGRRIRLLLIDAPELSQRPWGTRARDALARLAPLGAVVGVEHDVQERDRYNRTLAYLYTTSGRMINLAMAESGYVVASVYPPNVQHVERIRAGVVQARSQRLGLWATPAFSCLPADHRRGQC